MEIEKSRPQRTDSIVPIWVLKPESKDSISSSVSPDLEAEIFPASVPTGSQWGREKKILSSQVFYSIQTFSGLI